MCASKKQFPAISSVLQVKANELLAQIATVIWHARADYSLAPVFYAGKRMDASSVVVAWADLADDAALQACFSAAEDRLNEIRNADLVWLVAWASTGAVALWALSKATHSPVLAIAVIAFFGFVFAVRTHMTSGRLLQELHTIAEACALTLYLRESDWCPFLQKGWLRRRRLRKISWVLRKIAQQESNNATGGVHKSMGPPPAAHHVGNTIRTHSAASDKL